MVVKISPGGWGKTTPNQMQHPDRACVVALLSATAEKAR